MEHKTFVRAPGIALPRLCLDSTWTCYLDILPRASVWELHSYAIAVSRYPLCARKSYLTVYRKRYDASKAAISTKIKSHSTRQFTTSCAVNSLTRASPKNTFPDEGINGATAIAEEETPAVHESFSTLLFGNYEGKHT